MAARIFEGRSEVWFWSCRACVALASPPDILLSLLWNWVELNDTVAFSH